MKTIPSTSRLGLSLKIALSALVVMIFTPSFAVPQERDSKASKAYYPLSKGNTWKYEILSEALEKPREFVTWKVVNLSRDARGAIFGVWPTPAQSDDDGMQLQFTTDGLKELGSNFFVLRFPLVKGLNWAADGHERVFTVKSEGEPCTVGKYKFTRCAVIQDDDREAKLRTLTTYARGVGPVRYEYHKLEKEDAETQPTQTMEIVSYLVQPSTVSASAPSSE